LIEKTQGIVILDVSPVYANGHLPGAINYPVGDGSLDKALPTLDKGKTYLVYCHADALAIAGAQKLVDAGFAVEK
jgi:rhodanese-related sulfurtransferase